MISGQSLRSKASYKALCDHESKCSILSTDITKTSAPPKLIVPGNMNVKFENARFCHKNSTKYQCKKNKIITGFHPFYSRKCPLT